MTITTTYQGGCGCGKVQIELSGKPAAMGYCHCDSCREWSASPVNAFTLWPPDAIKIIKGIDKLGSFSKTPASYRKWCKSCGGHVYADHPKLGLVDVYASVLPTLPFEPQLHVHYQERVMTIKDGLTKMKDFPENLGGSGETIDD